MPHTMLSCWRTADRLRVWSWKGKQAKNNLLSCLPADLNSWRATNLWRWDTGTWCFTAETVHFLDPLTEALEVFWTFLCIGVILTNLEMCNNNKKVVVSSSGEHTQQKRSILQSETHLTLIDGISLFLVLQRWKKVSFSLKDSGEQMMTARKGEEEDSWCLRGRWT